jgi:type I restriction enzyme R subunit
MVGRAAESRSRRTGTRFSASPDNLSLRLGGTRRLDVRVDGGPPEEHARFLIDSQLTASGWFVCDRAGVDLVNHEGVAVREVALGDAGRADYLLYIQRRVVGAIEAKPEGTPLTGVQWQTARDAEGLPAEMRLGAVLVDGRLPFLFEASGSETVFTNLFDPVPGLVRP